MNRSVNVNRIVPNTGNTTPLFGTPSANAFVLILDPGFVSGWMTFVINSNLFFYNSMEYNYENNPSMQAMTEPVGGLGTSVNNSWTGVPVIGFSAMAADVGPAQLGETIGFIRETNRD